MGISPIFATSKPRKQAGAKVATNAHAGPHAVERRIGEKVVSPCYFQAIRNTRRSRNKSMMAIPALRHTRVQITGGETLERHTTLAHKSPSSAVARQPSTRLSTLSSSLYATAYDYRLETRGSSPRRQSPASASWLPSLGRPTLRQSRGEPRPTAAPSPSPHLATMCDPSSSNASTQQHTLCVGKCETRPWPGRREDEASAMDNCLLGRWCSALSARPRTFFVAVSAHLGNTDAHTPRNALQNTQTE